MSPAARSILVYSVYLFGLGAALLLVPNIPLPIFGLPEAHEVWIRATRVRLLHSARRDAQGVAGSGSGGGPHES